MSGRYKSSRLPTVAIFALAVAAVAAEPADPTITPPAILPRQNNAQFIGFIEQNGTWYSETCNPGLTWYQNGNYVQCCPATLASCYAPTACVAGSLIYPLPDRSTTTTIACTSNFDDPSFSICNTAFIFENLSDSSPKTDIVCGASSVNWSYYRQIPASATEVQSKAPGSIPQPVSTSLVLPNTTRKKSGGSKAWIAGVVVGPIVGLALIGALLLFCLRRRKNKRTAPQQGSAAMASVHPGQPPVGVAGHTDAKPQPPQQYQSNVDPYANQSMHAPQGNYANSPGDPPVAQNYAGMPPQNAGPAPYNAGNAPYNAGAASYIPPGSPPPQQTFYGNDTKHAYTGATGGGATPAGHTAELGGDSTGMTAPSELQSNRMT